MKLVVLVEGNKKDFENLSDAVKIKKSLSVDTGRCANTQEYSYLIKAIRKFSQSDKEIMLAKFSGRESLIQELGDESPEMIVTLSYNKNSKYYADCPCDTLLDLVGKFEKETIDYGIGIKEGST